MRAKLPLEYEVWTGHSGGLHFLGPGFPRILPPTTLRITAEWAGRRSGGLGKSEECLMGQRAGDATAYGSTISQVVFIFSR